MHQNQKKYLYQFNQNQSNKIFLKSILLILSSCSLYIIKSTIYSNLGNGCLSATLNILKSNCNVVNIFPING